MFGALLLNIGLGVLWGAIGITMSLVAASGGSICAFYAVGASLTAVATWLFMVDWPVLLSTDPDVIQRLVVWMAPAGALNAIAQPLILLAMRRGHRGLAWAIGQSALIVPFLVSIIIWGDRPGALGWMGVGCLLVGVVCLGQRKADSDSPTRGRGWVPLAICGMAFLGANQALLSVPSNWEGFVDSARVRTPLTMTGASIVYAVTVWRRRLRPTRAIVRLASVWAACAFVSYLGLFRCLDLMAGIGLSGLVFPIGVGACIATFSLYSHMRLNESYSRAAKIGVAAIVVGIALMGLS